MPPSNAMENDKKRLRNQFTKDERTRLLGIMAEYGPLLDDKNISILSRKEIWEIIENKFNENGHSGRTSAQLKKYWQNYKYHSKRTKIVHKEVPKPLSPMTKHMVRMLAKVNPEDWAQYNVAEKVGSIKKSPESSISSPSLATRVKSVPLCTSSEITPRDERSEVPSTPPQRLSKASTSDASEPRGGPEDLNFRTAGRENAIPESNVVVSTTDVPGSSVTVSVICPEVSTKSRTIFLKKNTPRGKIVPMTQSNQSNNQNEHGPKDFSPEAGNSDLYGHGTGDTQSGRITVRKNEHGSRLDVVGILPKIKSDKSTKRTGRHDRSAGVDDPVVNRSRVVNGEKSPDNKSPINMKARVTGRLNQTELIGNLIGLVKGMPTGKARHHEDPDSMEGLGAISMTNGRDEKTRISVAGNILNPFSTGQIILRENQAAGVEKGNCDYSGSSELLQGFSAVEKSSKRVDIFHEGREMTETLKKVGNDRHFRKDLIEASNQKQDVDSARYIVDRNANSLAQDLLWLKLYLKLLRSIDQAGGRRRLEILGKTEPLFPGVSSSNRRTQNNEENSDCSFPPGSEQGMEVDEEMDPENETRRLRVRRASATGPTFEHRVDQIQPEVKIEPEIETEDGDDAQNPGHDNAADSRGRNSIDHLVQAKLRCAKSELDHQLKLQRLEMEEKELRVRIAEMTIQETRLRIQALVEERSRVKELHELRLAQLAAEKVRSEAEHAARIDASCIATAEARARINNIERDRERSENLYQMQLRCISAGNTNGQCAVKCKQYQQ